jgi:Mg2+-importing ATPase
VLPTTPLAHTLGFTPLPVTFFAALVGMVVGYLVLIECGKRIFYRTARTPATPAAHDNHHRHLRRRIARFSSRAPTRVRPQTGIALMPYTPSTRKESL